MKIFKVAEFIEFLNAALAEIVPRDELAVEGEVSNFNIAQNQWVRFDLKDDQALLNCFLTIWQLKVPLEDGMKIRVYGYPKVYARYGKLSMVVQQIELVGEGALKKAFELLKKKLAAEGLFEVSRKRLLPRFPQRVALITSPGAAAYTDFLRILDNRWRGVAVDLLPVTVQGVKAVGEIVGAFKWLNAHAQDYDACVLTRGGGSLEDLQAFNSEEVARAIYASKVPVICGVGHERDETLADYTADVRASTPSNAAERLVPDYREVLGQIHSATDTIINSFERWLSSQREQVEGSVWRLQSFISEHKRRLTSLFLNLRGRFLLFNQDVERRSVLAREGAGRLAVLMNGLLVRVRGQVVSEERLLKTLDPRAVLERGYSIVFDPAGRVVKSSAEVDTGMLVRIKLKQGGLLSEVKSVGFELASIERSEFG